MVKYNSKNDGGPSVISFNTETGDFDRVDTYYADKMYWVPWDGEWLVKDVNNDIILRKNVTAGDLVLKMYATNNSSVREFFFIDNADLKDYMRRLKELYGKKRAEECCDPCEPLAGSPIECSSSSVQL